MKPEEIIATAKGFYHLPPEQAGKLMEDMGREDVRAVLWLLSTGLHNTITPNELQIEINNNKEYRANQL